MNLHTPAIASRSLVRNRPGRRLAATLGASAALTLTLVGPAFASLPHDPPPSPASAQCENYLGAGTLGSCTKSSTVRGAGAASSNSAELKIPGPADVPKFVVNPGQPTNVPAIGIGVAASVVVAGGLLMASVSRRRTA
jgi:hypothetical protein